MQRVDYVIMGAVALILVFGGLLFLPSGPSEFTINSAYADGCNQLVMKYRCDQTDITSMTSLKTGNAVYTFGNICAAKGFTDTFSCARSCGCNVTAADKTVLFETPLVSFSDSPVTEGFVIIDEPEVPEEEENVA